MVNRVNNKTKIRVSMENKLKIILDSGMTIYFEKAKDGNRKNQYKVAVGGNQSVRLYSKNPSRLLTKIYKLIK